MRQPTPGFLAATSFLLFLTLAAGACAPHGSSSAPPAAAPPPAPAGTRIALHWNDAADTTRTLHWPSDKPFRVALTVSGLVDSVQGFEMHFRLEPTTTNKGTAWKLAATPECSAAIWAGTVEPDRMARAPWPNKLAITDARAQEDGSVFMIVAVAFDLVKLDPDSTYSLGHMDFQPPQPASAQARCAGWDAPVRIFIESATALYTERKGSQQPVQNFGKPLYFEPEPPR